MRTVLVIEDNDAVREELIEILSLEGFTAIGAEDGCVGVQRIREHHPDLVICDVMMPCLDGYGMLAAVRGDPVLARTPFVFLTARKEEADVRKGLALGANGYLTKPFLISELLSIVSANLPSQAEG